MLYCSLLYWTLLYYTDSEKLYCTKLYCTLQCCTVWQTCDCDLWLSVVKKWYCSGAGLSRIIAKHTKENIAFFFTFVYLFRIHHHKENDIQNVAFLYRTDQVPMMSFCYRVLIHFTYCSSITKERFSNSYHSWHPILSVDLFES